MVDPHGTFAIRAVRTSDEAAIERLLTNLDPESRYRRWFSYAVDVRRASRWAAHPDLDAALGLVALSGDEIVGHGVMIPISDQRAEVAFEVAAPWRRHGVAGALLEALIERAVKTGTRELCADVLEGNSDMLAVFHEHGDHVDLHGGGVVSITVPLTAHAS